MDFYGIDRDATIAHCDSLAVGRHDRDTHNICSWSRIHPEHVVDLLDNAAPDARGDSRDLATMLSRFSWRIRGDTASGQNSGNRIVNNVRGIMVSVAGRNFQLHCTQTPSLKLERITA